MPTPVKPVKPVTPVKPAFKPAYNYDYIMDEEDAARTHTSTINKRRVKQPDGTYAVKDEPFTTYSGGIVTNNAAVNPILKQYGYTPQQFAQAGFKGNENLTKALTARHWNKEVLPHMQKKVPQWNTLDPRVRQVLGGVAYNVGTNKINNFKKMLINTNRYAATKDPRYLHGVIKELNDSARAKQLPDRTKRETDMLKKVYVEQARQWALRNKLQKTQADPFSSWKTAAEVKIKKGVAKGQKIDTSPTDAKIEAENYSKGHVTIGGLPISIENPVGSLRSGTSDDGESWSQKMYADYGYIKGSIGYDKDHLDVFINPDWEPGDEDDHNVYVVNQVWGKNFDEHKCMLGYKNKTEAKAAYLKNYEKGWKGCDTIVAMEHDYFKDWALGPGPKKGRVHMTVFPKSLEKAAYEDWTKDGDSTLITEAEVREAARRHCADNGYANSEEALRDISRQQTRDFEQRVADNLGQKLAASEKGWIGVDLDKTLARFGHWIGPSHIGAPIPKMVNRVKKWLAEGKRVKIFTARVSGEGADEARRAIKKWTKEHLGQELEVTCKKDMYCQEIWDDIARGMVKNIGRQKKGPGRTGINVDIKVGDIVRVGRFKNKKVKVEEIGTDDLGHPTVNGRKLLTLRLDKLMPGKPTKLKDTEPIKKTAALDELKKAKTHSDKGEYAKKHAILKYLLKKHPEAFKIDASSAENGDPNIAGITHKPTGFQIHTKKSEMPIEFSRDAWANWGKGTKDRMKQANVFSALWEGLRERAHNPYSKTERDYASSVNAEKYKDLEYSDRFGTDLKDNREAISSIVNGMGTPTSKLYQLYPDTLHGMDITPVTDIHDYDYTYPGEYASQEEASSARGVADRRFRSNLLALIKKSSTGDEDLDARRLKAAIAYHRMLAIGGGKAFLEGKLIKGKDKAASSVNTWAAW